MPRPAIRSPPDGVAIGLPLTYVAGRLLQSTLFGVSGHDVRIAGAGVVLLAVAAGVAALIPARRAAVMDPMRALRVE